MGCTVRWNRGRWASYDVLGPGSGVSIRLSPGGGRGPGWIGALGWSLLFSLRGSMAPLVWGGMGTGMIVTPLWVASFLSRSFRVLACGRVRSKSVGLPLPSGPLQA